MNAEQKTPTGADLSPSPDRPVARGRGTAPRDVLQAAGLALADFVAVTVMLTHLVSRFQHDHADARWNADFMLSSDLATPLVAWVWFLIVLNGLALCASRRTRSAGIGLLLASAVIAVPVVTWVVWTIATFSIE
jgi:hypothetical protein